MYEECKMKKNKTKVQYDENKNKLINISNIFLQVGS